MLRSSAQPQTEDEERDALIAECGLLTGQALRLTGTLPAAIASRIAGDAGLDFGKLASPEIAAICEEIRAECPAAAEGEA